MEISRSDVMMNYVENYYRESLFYTAQNNAKGAEFDIIHTIIEDMPNQFNPQTATWGLRLWEELLGIDGGMINIEERRKYVMMKLLTLQRITPISLERLIKNITKANVDIIRNVAPYTFQVRIKDDSLDCDNGLIRKIVEEYKEAHMAFCQAYYMGRIVLREQFYFKTITMFSCYWWRKKKTLLDGEYFLNGEIYLDGSFPLEYNGFPEYKTKVSHQGEIVTKEIFSAPKLTVTHNLWYLDGSVLLDGSRTLDAYKIEEVLE